MRFLSVLTMLVAIASAAPAWSDCSAVNLELKRALGAGDFVAAERAAKAIGLSRECSPAQRRAARSDLARRMIDEAKRLRQAAGSTDASDRLVEAAAALRVSWEAALADGDLKLRRKAYGAAAAAYGDAIDLLASDQVDSGRSEIGKDELAYLTRRADESRHLAASGPDGHLVETPSDRSGNKGGVYSSALNRGAEATRVPVPILFGFNSDQFTPVGQQAAEEFVTLIAERKPRSILITGHTDRIGSQEFNQDLSLRRAKKVAEFLRANGITGDVRIAGKGKSEPRVLADPSVYDQSQIDELNRRVEFDWKP